MIVLENCLKLVGSKGLYIKSLGKLILLFYLVRIGI